MKKRNIYIALFIISICGLAFVQYQYLRIGLNLAKVQFNANLGKVSDEVVNDLKTKNQLTYLIAMALKEDNSFFTTSVDSVQGASRHFLNDFITEKLVTNGIETDFSYRLVSKDSAYYLASPKVFEADDEFESYPIELIGYLPEILENRLVLELQFKNLNRYFLAKLNGLTLPSLLFLIGIFIAVLWVLRTFYWQQNVITTTNEFINNLTHELKTPVFSIGLATKILEDSALTEQKPILNMIRQQVKKLTLHIDKVLELGNLESGKNLLKLEKVNFRPYLLGLCNEFKTLVAIENVTFNFELEEKDFMIEAAIFHLENAINNILDNAKKYSKNPVIQLKAVVSQNRLIIDITDNGVGISEEDMERIFVKYYRVNGDDNSQPISGYGLGLSYVKKVIEKHMGNVSVESEKGKGSKVSIIIPIKND